MAGHVVPWKHQARNIEVRPFKILYVGIVIVVGVGLVALALASLTGEVGTLARLHPPPATAFLSNAPICITAPREWAPRACQGGVSGWTASNVAHISSLSLTGSQKLPQLPMLSATEALLTVMTDFVLYYWQVFILYIEQW